MPLPKMSILCQRIRQLLPLAGIALGLSPLQAADQAATVDFNRDIRPILSNNCFYCHGPDDKQRKGGKNGLRLDTPEGQREDLGGYAAVAPGRPEASDLIKRIITDDEDDHMPPKMSGKKISPGELDLLKRWISSGAKFTKHWSYEKLSRPPLPEIRDPKPAIGNGIDRFVFSKLAKLGLKPQAEADRSTLARRVALDLTGLPPALEEVDAFLNDKSADAYERFVDKMLAKETYGEHWARNWLDLARYADSAGYADDPPRKIWAYRDYVIRAFNKNIPFDQFTREQLAGDLLPDAGDEQIIATAFHRNTMTNNEGGTVDEEFRNAAIVDRVNTTMAVWMGTSMACAQCHSHKFDPITNEEYFQFFAFLNNTADSDKRDESPVLEFFTDELKVKRTQLDAEFADLEKKFKSPEMIAAAQNWARVFAAKLDWQTPKPSAIKTKSNANTTVLDDNSIVISDGVKTDTYTVELPFDSPSKLTALRVEALTYSSLPSKGPGHSNGNFVVTRVTANILPVPNQAGPRARFVRIELPGKQKFLQLAEVQVFSSGENVAPKGEAKLSGTYIDADAKRAIDGNTDGEYKKGSVAHANQQDDPWWEVDLKGELPVERIVVWNRAETGDRLEGFRVVALDENRKLVWEKPANKAPKADAVFALTGARDVEFAEAMADFNQADFDASLVIKDAKPGPNKKTAQAGWAVGGATGKDHTLTLLAKQPADIPAGATLSITIEQQSKHENHTLGRLRVGVSSDARAAEHVRTPVPVLAALGTEESKRDEQQRGAILDHFVRRIAPQLAAERSRLAALQRERDAIKPVTVPVYREIAGGQRRKTLVQVRGNYLVTTDEVGEAVPAAWHPLPKDAPKNRLTLAQWLMDKDNPLTPRVIANRFWEQIFGIGIVRTSEEFGSQGELPANQELLDWLACELVGMKWDMKKFLKLIVTSSAYRQSSRVIPETLEKDPENRFLSRGPRFRMSAEMVRDQALAVSGLLSPKMYGPSVRPIQPNQGLSAAFGGNLDWQTSTGDDAHRRGIYTEWRRTSPYPSMATFDAPSRESCTIRRNLTNTPLQALVTMNDPVFIEAAQSLARLMIAANGTPQDKVNLGFRSCLIRVPTDAETTRIVKMRDETLALYQADVVKAKDMATNPIGAAPQGTDIADLAAWTVVANVILNLDEALMKR